MHKCVLYLILCTVELAIAAKTHSPLGGFFSVCICREREREREGRGRGRELYTKQHFMIPHVYCLHHAMIQQITLVQELVLNSATAPTNDMYTVHVHMIRVKVEGYMEYG